METTLRARTTRRTARGLAPTAGFCMAILSLVLGCGGGGGGSGGGATPQILSITPDQGSEVGSTPVVILGSNFVNGCAVLLRGRNCLVVTFVSSTEVNVLTPPGNVGPADLTLINPNGKSSIVPGGFTYLAAIPRITSVFPPAGSPSGRTTVTIRGAEYASGPRVTFGGAGAISIIRVSTAELRVVTPPGNLGPVDVTVTNQSGGSDTLVGGFEYRSDILQEALGIAGISAADFGWNSFDYSIMPGVIINDPFRLSFYDSVHDDALTAPAYFQGLVDETDADATGPNPISDLIDRYSFLLDRPVAPGDPFHSPSPSDPLAQAVADLITAQGGTPDLPALQADAADVPILLQQQAAEIVLAIRDGAAARDNAFAQLTPADVDLFYEFTAAFVALRSDLQILNPANATVKSFLNNTASYMQLYQGAYDLARTIENQGLAADPAYVGFSFNQQTPIGRIIIEDNADHTYDPAVAAYSGDIALVIDTGGADVYRISAGGTTRTGPVSVAIDLAGNDSYAYEVVPHPDDVGNRLPSDIDGRADPASVARQNGYGPISLSDAPRQGAGRLGIGLLFDMGLGADTYESLRMSQGFGVLGVGALFDDGGDDTYMGENAVQASGIFGIGILVDLSGIDSYETYHGSQGFGYVRGAGVLFDLDGDDSYWADEGGDPIYYSPQDPGNSNSSFCQGAGFGLRFDALQEWWSGGIGFLRDVAGADDYWASIFAQATGYWYGTGVLADSAGPDQYDAKWYVQAGAAHFAMALLLEGGGNDIYNASITPMNVLLGGGHDYSLAMVIEESGDDTYTGAGLSLGAGNANGIGLFADNYGTDTYNAIRDNAIGSATADSDPQRQARKTVGFFLEADGAADVYSKPAANVGNDQTWTQAQTGQGIELGVGVDRPQGNTTLHFR